MAKTENPIGKGTRQIVINLHQEDAQRAPEASVINHGEVVVQGTDEDAKLYVKRKTGGIATFIESATTHNAIQAAITEVEGYVQAQGYALSGNLDTLSATVVSDYATSANTESAIATAKAAVEGTNADDSGATTVYGAKAYTDAKIDQVIAGSVTGATGDDYVNAEVVDHVVTITAGSGVTDAVSKKHEHENMTVLDGISAEDVKAWDAAEENAYGRASGYTDTVSGNIETKINQVSGNVETALNAETSARTQADSDLSDRIAALEAISGKTESALQEVTATGDTYVNASVAGKSAITVSTVTGSVETGEDKLAVASDVKAYVGSVSGNVENKINTVSGAIETKINTVSGAIETKINTVSGNLETAINNEASARTDADKALSDRIDAIESGSVVTVEKLNAPTSSAYAATYVVKQNGEQVGAAIDIPKDYLVKSATIEVCETADVPVPGLQPGDKYIDFVVNAKDGQGEESHIYLPVADLAHVYSAGNGIEISSGDVVSAKVVAANGLSVDANGIAMSLADGSNNGAMSSADYTKLAGVASGAQVNVIETVKVNGTPLSVEDKAVDVTVAEGATDGTIAVNGADVAVHGLGSAAYENTTAFDAAGAADAVLGTSADTSANTTVYGVKDYAKQYADSIVASSLTGATGDTLVNATVNGKVVEVSATQNLQNAVASAHSHANKDVLDGITAEKVTAWDAAEQNAKGYADGIVSGLSGNIITYVNTASGNIETALNAETSARTQADSGLSNRIAALEAISGKTESALQEVTATGDTFVTAQVDGKSAITVSTVTGSVATDTGKLAVTNDVKSYVDTASGNIETALGSYATSADTVSAIASAKSEVIGTTGDTSGDTTIEGVKKYVDEKVSGESIASVDVNNKDAMAISATTVDRAVTLDFTNMIIDCGTY